jgi:nucleotide-binding universal stress UspA family protein
MTGPPRGARVRSILVPVDGSASSRRAVELAVEMATALDASLRLLHVAPVSDLPALIGESESPRGTEEGQVILAEAARLAKRRGVEPAIELRRGRASGQILRSAEAHRPDLIVMGTRGLTGARSVLMGSVSRAVSRGAKTQVVLVR